MASLPKSYRRVVLVRRPPGEPAESDFRVEEVPMPEPRHGEALVKVAYLSLDPYQRGRMREAASYAANVSLGEVMTGGVVGEVVASQHPAFKVGDTVEGSLGWQEYAVAPGTALRKVDPSLAPISTANGVLGMPGMTAYFGLLEVGQPKPGDTVLVSAAAGAVGSMVGQIAKIAGCRVVGTAGGKDKCDWLVRELGFDAAVDYKAGGVRRAIAEAAPGGIDVYFDNTGGPVLDVALFLMNLRGRVVCCGNVSQYDVEKPAPGPMTVPGLVVVKRIRMEGFIVTDFYDRRAEAEARLARWIADGRIKAELDIFDGLERAPEALIGLFEGNNRGKRAVRV
jgi:NADPH-dependent curcumin reductase CurA